jgi:hypothetical protein
MISGGEHLQWPSYDDDGDLHRMDQKLESPVEYEEWLWEQDLQTGPPQDDDIAWIADKAWAIGWDEAQGKINPFQGDERLAQL